MVLLPFISAAGSSARCNGASLSVSTLQQQQLQPPIPQLCCSVQLLGTRAPAGWCTPPTSQARPLQQRAPWQRRPTAGQASMTLSVQSAGQGEMGQAEEGRLRSWVRGRMRSCTTSPSLSTYGEQMGAAWRGQHSSTWQHAPAEAWHHPAWQPTGAGTARRPNGSSAAQGGDRIRPLRPHLRWLRTPWQPRTWGTNRQQPHQRRARGRSGATDRVLRWPSTWQRQAGSSPAATAPQPA